MIQRHPRDHSTRSSPTGSPLPLNLESCSGEDPSDKTASSVWSNTTGRRAEWRLSTFSARHHCLGAATGCSADTRVGLQANFAPKSQRESGSWPTPLPMTRSRSIRRDCGPRFWNAREILGLVWHTCRAGPISIERRQRRRKVLAVRRAVQRRVWRRPTRTRHAHRRSLHPSTSQTPPAAGGGM